MKRQRLARRLRTAVRKWLQPAPASGAVVVTCHLDGREMARAVVRDIGADS